MGLQVLQGITLKKMFICACAVLEKKKNIINSLNVFPVPDGDTGTNMYLTLKSAIEQIDKLESATAGEVAQSIANGSLMGARGNSGVILSQLFRGFARDLAGKDVVTTREFADALQEGAITAYKAVMKPVEGTMLTVAWEAARSLAVKAEEEDFEILMKELVHRAEESLEKTPQMLPVLKQAGVVDAGGKGLCAIYEGFLKTVQGNGFELEVVNIESEFLEEEPVKQVDSKSLEHSKEEIEFQYCTEFLLNGENLETEEIQELLRDEGDSLLVVGTGDMLRVHIHTNHPGRILEIGLGRGELSQIMIDNMKEQHKAFNETAFMEKGNNPVEEDHDNNQDSAKINEVQVIAVSPGEGLNEIFKSLGVSQIIKGGQTMNPSTEDFLRAINNTPSNKIIILPNNKNIILAAEQSKELTSNEVEVVSSKTIPQGISALMQFNPFEKSVKENASNMEKALAQVKTGKVTYAVKETNFEGINVKNGSIIGFVEDILKIVGEDSEAVALSLIKEMHEKNDEIITLYYGSNIDEEEAKKLSEFLQEQYLECQIEYYRGGQPFYYYFISIE